MVKTILILHGWRLEGKRYSESKALFEKQGFIVYSPTLPGSGTEKLIKPVMEINDYIDFVLAYLKKHKIAKTIIIGHSFGGRIAAKLAAQHPSVVEKLVLTGAPVIKQNLSFKKEMLVGTAKLIKQVLKRTFGEERFRKVLYYLLGEWDYYKAPVEIRETFKKIIAEDIAPNLPNIKAPTLVVWGGADTFVLPKIGRMAAQRIPNATYVEIPNATHKLPYENPKAFTEAIISFIS